MQRLNVIIEMWMVQYAIHAVYLLSKRYVMMRILLEHFEKKSCFTLQLVDQNSDICKKIVKSEKHSNDSGRDGDIWKVNDHLLAIWIVFITRIGSCRHQVLIVTRILLSRGSCCYLDCVVIRIFLSPTADIRLNVAVNWNIVWIE